MSPEDLRTIRLMIRDQLAGQMMATVAASPDSKRASARRFSGENAIPNMRVLLPHGFASRPKVGTEVLVGAINHDPTHLNVVGGFDSARPAVDAEGESCLYGPEGQLVYMKSGGKVLIGSKAATEPLVLGNVLKDFASQLISEIKSTIDDIKAGPVAVTTTPGNPAPTHPALIAKLALHEAALDQIVSTFVTTVSTNFVSKSNFTERGA